MDKQAILNLFNYNYWANARVLDAVTRLTPDQFVAPVNLSYPSLHVTLVHILGAEIVWRLRCQEGLSLPSMPLAANYATLELLRLRWRAEEGLMRGYLATLTDERLQQTVCYETTNGIPYENVLWQVLVHVVNHGTQFRAEAGVALAGFGQSPGDLDFIVYLRQ